MKQPPKLTLISNIIEQNKSTSAQELLSVENLAVDVRNNLTKISQEIFPNSILVAAIKTVIGNEFHPVILLSEGSAPSVLRVVREKDSGLKNTIAVLGENFSRYSILNDFAKNTFSWGILNKEIWYCRKLFDKTLEQNLKQNSLSPYQVFNIAINLIEQLEKFQQTGLIHGHLTPTNVYYSSEEDIQLLDPFIAINQILNPENYFKYDLSSFAPEFFAEKKLTSSLDLFGFGLILKALHQNLENNQMSFSALELAESRSLKNIYELLLDRQPEKRLNIELLKSCLANSANNLIAVGVLNPLAAQVPRDKHSTSQSQAIIQQKDLGFSVRESRSLAASTVSQNNGVFYFFLLAITGITVFFTKDKLLNYFQPTGVVVDEQLMNSDFRDEWSSKIPSRMLHVALVALSDSPNHREAESVIISSAKREDDNGAGVNNALIKIAFKDSWELELNPGDRRAALVLGLGGLLKKQSIADLPGPKSLHPGIVLAILSSLNDKVDSTPALLNEIPPEVLLKLPVPFGEAFKYLLDANPNLNFADRSIAQLASLGTKGIELEKLSDFIKANPLLHLKALAKIFSLDKDNSRIVLELLVNNPLFSGINLESLSWAKGFSLINWQELSANQKLSLIAGEVNFENISSENVLKLITHPSVEVRSAALNMSLLEVKFQHPASIEAVKILQNNPNLLSPEQMMELIRFLINPEAITLDVFNKWLEKKPDLEILKAILLGSCGLEKPTAMDTAIASELKKLNWKPSVDILKRLCSHSDKFTRLFAYNEIYLLEDKETSRELLNLALKYEKDEACREQLNQMLSSITIGK